MWTAHQSPVFGERVDNGLYDHVVDQIVSMGPRSLAESVIDRDFARATSWGENLNYIDKVSGVEATFTLVGEVCGSHCGTRHSAAGNYYGFSKGDQVSSLSCVHP